MQIDLLLPKPERGAALAEGDDLHAEDARIEVTGQADISDGQDEVIETRDLHGRPRSWVEAQSLPRATRHGQAAVAEKR